MDNPKPMVLGREANPAEEKVIKECQDKLFEAGLELIGTRPVDR